MAANVVVALFYYLLWTATLFTPAPGGGAESAGRGPARAERLPAPLAATLALTASVAVVLSVAPQLVLQVVGGSLF